MNFKRWIGVILTGAMALSLAACGNTGNISTTNQGQVPDDGTASGKTVVTLTASSAVPGFETAFEAACPDIDLQVEKLATGVINGEVRRRLRNDHASDLIVTTLPRARLRSTSMI